MYIWICFLYIVFGNGLWTQSTWCLTSWWCKMTVQHCVKLSSLSRVRESTKGINQFRASFNRLLFSTKPKGWFSPHGFYLSGWVTTGKMREFGTLIFPLAVGRVVPYKARWPQVAIPALGMLAVESGQVSHMSTLCQKWRLSQRSNLLYRALK